jgi:hypothetical protein
MCSCIFSGTHLCPLCFCSKSRHVLAQMQRPGHTLCVCLSGSFAWRAGMCSRTCSCKQMRRISGCFRSKSGHVFAYMQRRHTQPECVCFRPGSGFWQSGMCSRTCSGTHVCLLFFHSESGHARWPVLPHTQWHMFGACSAVSRHILTHMLQHTGMSDLFPLRQRYM